MDVVVTVFLNLLEEDQLGLALGAEHSQQWGILLPQKWGEKPLIFVGRTGLRTLESQQ